MSKDSRGHQTTAFESTMSLQTLQITLKVNHGFVSLNPGQTVKII